MTIIYCPACDWIGHTYSVREISVDALRTLKPGQPVPHGHCPECKALIPFENQTDKGDLDWSDARPERANLTQFQRNCLLVALSRLDPNHPGFRAADHIELALRSTVRNSIPLPKGAATFGVLHMAEYMHSWVYPLLVGALYGETFPCQRGYVAGDAAQVRAELKVAALAKAAD